jgi:hypothetical protein
MKHPFESYSDCVQLWDIRSQTYNLRSVCGKLNASIVGMLNRAVIEDRKAIDEERHGRLADAGMNNSIDKANDALSDMLARDERAQSIGSMGLDTGESVEDTVRNIRGAMEEFLDATMSACNLDTAYGPIVNNFESSLTFMSTPRGRRHEDVEAAAKQLKMPLAVLTKAFERRDSQDARRLAENAPQILERFHELEPSADNGFDGCSARLKVRIANALTDALESRVNNLIGFIGRGGGRDILGDISLCRAAQSEIHAWALAQEIADPEFRDAADRAVA